MPNQRLLTAIITSWYALDKYYLLTDETTAYAAAILLHPSRRKRYIEKNWNRKYHKAAFDGVRKLWEAKYRDLDIKASSISISDVTKEPSAFKLAADELDVTGGFIDEYNTFI